MTTKRKIMLTFDIVCFAISLIGFGFTLRDQDWGGAWVCLGGLIFFGAWINYGFNAARTEQDRLP